MWGAAARCLLPGDTLLRAEEVAQPQVPQPKRSSSDAFPSPLTNERLAQ